MNWKLIIKLVSALNFILGSTMAAPLAIALFQGQSDTNAFAIALGVTFLTSGALYLLTRHAENDLSHKDAFLAVTLSWASVCFFASLPFWFSGQFGSFTNAFFESVSGFTTTGSTIATDIASLPMATLFWRSIIQWYGGMGIIVLSLAILPLLGVGGMQLFKAEVPGPTTDKLQPRMRDTALLLWKVYVALTAAEVVLLLLGGMSFFDSVCHAFTTLATGGFGTKPDSLMGLDSVYLEMVFTFFMIVAGVNFSLHFLALKGDFKAYFRDTEFKVYAFLMLGGTLILALVLWFSKVYDSPLEALRYGVFQVATIVTTTGYNSADFEAWGLLAPMATLFLFLLMFTGGMAGSTGGGVKIVRIWLLLKQGYRELLRLIHPRAVIHIKLSGKTVEAGVIDAIIGFIAIYILLMTVGAFVVSLFGYDFTTSFSAVAACIGNIGPGFGAVGPTDHFEHFPAVVKWMLALFMLLGRLEIYTVILLFVPEFWRR